MVVAGQPKTTSRVHPGDEPRRPPACPGSCCTVYNWARPRDLSHYETFEHYHATFYRHVEALSVTPFAPRALDRGLTGVLVSLMRLGGPEWNPNRGAGLVDPADRVAGRGRATTIRARADGQIGTSAAERSTSGSTCCWTQWRQRRRSGSARSSTSRRGKSDTDVSLLQEPGIEGWSPGRCRRRCATSRPRCRSSSGPSRHLPAGRGLGRRPSAPRPLPEGRAEESR